MKELQNLVEIKFAVSRNVHKLEFEHYKYIYPNIYSQNFQINIIDV